MTGTQGQDGSAYAAAMRRAVELADRGSGEVLPNPLVGCVIVAPSGEIVGEGWHERPGGPHAEVNALTAAGQRARGATAVVTLEPCNHTGRTGPCSAALIAAGVARVVIAVADPWPPAAGGAAAVRAAGIDVVEGVLSDDAAEMNRVWLTSMRQNRPYVTFKAGMTVDGRIAAADGTSKWITSAASRADAQLLRRRADTMVVGIGTVLADDPLLTVRDASGESTARQPLRVVVDTDGRTPADARVCNDEAPTWIATAAEVRRAAAGGLDLHDLLARLQARGRRHVLLEGGRRLASAFVEAGLVDEFVFYLAPMLLTAGSAVLGGTAVHTLTEAYSLELLEVTRIADDVKLRYRPASTAD